jgi:hypothetical protein
MGADMTEHDPFERQLRVGLAAERAPDSLRRRIAEIPLEHLRQARAAGAPSRLFGALFARPGVSWATSFAAAAASLALGVWLGMAGLASTDTGGGEDALVALVFSDTPTTIGDVQ